MRMAVMYACNSGAIADGLTAIADIVYYVDGLVNWRNLIADTNGVEHAPILNPFHAPFRNGPMRPAAAAGSL